MTPTKTLAAALLAAQKDFPPLERDAVNPHYRNRYTSLDHLLAKVVPVLNTHGLVVVQAPTVLEGQPALRTTLLHESGESFEDTMALLLDKQTPQGHGAALTYARRYALTAMLGLAGDEDDDGNALSQRGAPDPAGGRSPAPRGESAYKAPFEVPASEPQRKKLRALAAKLQGEQLITAEQLDAATVKACGHPFEAAIGLLTKAQALDLISRLTNFEKNAKAAA